MSELLKAALLLAAFALVSVLVTAVAAGLALHRPSASHLTLETRSRLVADYSSDPLAKRLQPLDPDVIRAAAQDEAELSENSPSSPPAEPLSTATPVGLTPRAATPELPPTATPERDATMVPTARPPAGSTGTPAPQPAGTSSPGAPTSTLGPSPTGTPVTPTPTYTPRPTFTPTPLPTATPLPPTNTPPPTTAPPPTATNQPQPTATPKPGATPILCELLPLPPPLCDD